MKKLFSQPPLYWIGIGVIMFIAAALNIADQRSPALILYSLAVGVLFCAIGIIVWIKENRPRKK